MSTVGLKKYGNLIYGVKPEVVEDTKVLIRIRKSKKDRQHDGHYKKSKRTNNDLQKTKV
jgi:hypothetical protein